MSTSQWSDVSQLTSKVIYSPSNEEAVLISDAPGAGYNFGYKVIMDATGTRIVANTSIGNGQTNRRIEIFVRTGTTWSRETTITSGLPNDTDTNWGNNILINADGDKLLIAESNVTVNSITGAGQIHYYTRTGSTWTFMSYIQIIGANYVVSLGSGTMAGDINFNRIIVTANGRVPDDAFFSGFACIFTRSGSTWSQEAILFGTNRAPGDLFGARVSIDATGTRAAITAEHADLPDFLNTGKVYVFVRSGTTWSMELDTSISDKAANARIGRAGGVKLSADGHYFILSRSFGTVNKVYIFAYNGTSWSEVESIIPSDWISGDVFSGSISCDDNLTRIIATSYGATQSGNTNAGKAYIFS